MVEGNEDSEQPSVFIRTNEGKIERPQSLPEDIFLWVTFLHGAGCCLSHQGAATSNLFASIPYQATQRCKSGSSSKHQIITSALSDPDMAGR